MTESTLIERLDRIESHLAIQQLPSRYALAVDARDLDAWLDLFVEDVDCGRHGKGREAFGGGSTRNCAPSIVRIIRSAVTSSTSSMPTMPPARCTVAPSTRLTASGS